MGSRLPLLLIIDGWTCHVGIIGTRFASNKNSLACGLPFELIAFREDKQIMTGTLPTDLTRLFMAR